MINILGNLIRNLMTWMGASEIEARHASDMADFIGVLLIGIFLYYVAKFIIVRVLRKIAKRTKSIWDDVLLEKKVFNRMAFLLPGILVYQFAPSTLEEFPGLVSSVVKVLLAMTNSVLRGLRCCNMLARSAPSRFETKWTRISACWLAASA